MTDHWKDAIRQAVLDNRGNPWCVYDADTVDAARAKDAEALERTQAALDKAVETLHGVRLRDRDRNAELAAKNAEITRLSAVLDWALDAHAAGKRREDIPGYNTRKRDA